MSSIRPSSAGERRIWSRPLSRKVAFTYPILRSCSSVRMRSSDFGSWVAVATEDGRRYRLLCSLSCILFCLRLDVSKSFGHHPRRNLPNGFRVDFLSSQQCSPSAITVREFFLDRRLQQVDPSSCESLFPRNLIHPKHASRFRPLRPGSWSSWARTARWKEDSVYRWAGRTMSMKLPVQKRVPIACTP